MSKMVSVLRHYEHVQKSHIPVEETRRVEGCPNLVRITQEGSESITPGIYGPPENVVHRSYSTSLGLHLRVHSLSLDSVYRHPYVAN